MLMMQKKFMPVRTVLFDNVWAISRMDICSLLNNMGASECMLKPSMPFS